MNHKLLFDDLLDDEFELIAIHCSVEDYRMAYLLNACLNVSFARKPKDLDIGRGGKEIHFSLYEYDDKVKHTLYQLVSNIAIVSPLAENSRADESTSLFSSEPNRHYLIPEYKCDYFIKLSSEFGKIPVKENISKINDIRQVISVYSVAIDDLKSPYNLIFD